MGMLVQRVRRIGGKEVKTMEVVVEGSGQRLKLGLGLRPHHAYSPLFLQPSQPQDCLATL